MQAVEQALISFFERVAQKDKAQLQMLEDEQGFSVERERWCFSLPQLHAFLQRHDEVFDRLDYKQFRQIIFASPINQTIKPHGAEITIADNQAKVDKSIYALVWQTGKAPPLSSG